MIDHRTFADMFPIYKAKRKSPTTNTLWKSYDL